VLPKAQSQSEKLRANLSAKCTKNRLAAGLRPDPLEKQRSPDLAVGFRERVGTQGAGMEEGKE